MINKSFSLYLLGIMFGYNMVAIAQIPSTHVVKENSSIKTSIMESSSFDTIYIEKGIYKEYDIVIDKPLTIIGNDFPIIDGLEKESIFHINSDYVTIRGLEIKNVGFSHTNEFAAIHISDSDHFTVEHNKLANVFFGIIVERSNNGIIRFNDIEGNSDQEFYAGNGVHVWKSKHIEIANNKLRRLRDGIYFEFVDHSTVKGNVSTNNIRYGLHFMFSNNDDYVDNRFENNGAGVAVMFSKRLKMKNNLFKQNWGATSFGLLLKEIYDADITNNKFLKNTVAIQVEGSSRINYLHNTFEENGWAIKVSGGCYENRILKNDFLSNSFDVAFNSNLNESKFDGNYWSSYSGYDLDKNGVGDVPYRPVKLFSYISHRSPESIILIRSLFIELLNFSEMISPIFTPVQLEDQSPKMYPIND